MKNSSLSKLFHLFRLGFLLIALGVIALGTTPGARAGLTLEMNVIRYHQYGWYFSPYLNTNTTGSSVPFGDYYVTSYGYPTNGSSALYHFDTNGFNQIGGGPYGYGDFDGMMHELTNGLWSIFVTNSVTTNVYHFKVTTTIVSNTLPYVAISFPADGAVNVTNRPTFTWQGPTNYGGIVVYYYNSGDSLPATQTSLLSGRVLYQGINNLTVHYDSNSTTAVVSSVPTNNAAQPISTWVSTAHLQDYSGSQFTVGTADTSGGSHTLVAHYPFNATNGSVLAAAVDTSGHGYNMTFGGSFGAQGGTNMTADAAAGIGAVEFHDGDNNSAGYLGWSNPTPAALLSALAGDFSVSGWIKTTQNIAWDQAPAYYGAGIVSADSGGLANDVIPLALTGSKIGFNTGGDSEDVTLNSVAVVNDGNYHHVVVTRKRTTGQKIIYVDGQFDSFSSGSTNSLNNPVTLTIGALGNAADPDPNNINYYQGYDGKLDDLQIYSGVLSSNEVAQLFASPGTTVPDGGFDFNAALNSTNLVWTTGGDANWFVETTNTHDSIAAAQSGVIGDNQQTWIQTTVTGPGTLNFWWRASSQNGSDYLEYDLDGNFQANLTGDSGWQNPSFSIAAGSHTLRWLYYKDSCCTNFLDAAFLDQVSFTNSPSLNVTANPQSGVPPLTVQFTSPGVDSSGHTVTNWAWNFGDGGISPAQSPAHVYTNAGFYSPSLIARSTSGTTPLSVTGLGTISVSLPTLNANATPQSGQTPLTVQFSTPSLDSAGFAVTNWNWTFGDGGTSTAQNPAHTYIYPGMFSPSLVARSTYSAAPITIVYGFTTITITNPPNPSFHILHTFTDTTGAASTNGDGKGPNGGLVLIGSALYGTAQRGGGNGFGTLFALHTDGSSFTNLYNFSLATNSGAVPPAGVILSGSRFFGTTASGGSRGGGTIFAINTNGLGYTNLLNYNSNVDPNSGSSPLASVALAGSSLYGLTWFGGAYDHGTLSYVNTNGTGSGILHHFVTPSGPNFNLNYDGLFPSSKLILSGSTLYGTAEGGGSYGRGTVFAVETNNPGSFRILHYFTALDPATSTNTDGAHPFAGLVLSGNTLYGTTFAGGASGYGNVFAVNTNGSGFTNLHSFDGSNGGYGPHGGLTLSGNTIYGTTSGGGSLGTLSSGTLFAIQTDGSGFKNLYSFSGGSDGANPQGDLVFSGNTLYGSAFAGGASGNGIVFSFSVTSPVLLINPQIAGVNFQFQFQSQAGFTHTVQYRTNLIAGLNWQTYSNVTGDDTLKTIPIPRSVFSPAQQGFVRILTQ